MIGKRKRMLVSFVSFVYGLVVGVLFCRYCVFIRMEVWLFCFDLGRIYFFYLVWVGMGYLGFVGVVYLVIDFMFICFNFVSFGRGLVVRVRG